MLKCMFPQVTLVLWDLDGTLGEKPGWEGDCNLNEYVHYSAHLKDNLNHLRRATGTTHIVVSRNLMLCDPHYSLTRRAFMNLGMDGALGCYRHLRHSKVKRFRDPSTVLLIDDSLRECVAAAQDGACALHIKGPTAVQSLESNNFDVYVPVPDR